MNHEKVKFANEVIYDLAPGGFMFTDETLRMILIMGENTLAQIDAETDNSVNTERIELLDTLGETDRIMKGYQYQTDLQRKRDYVIGDEEYEDGVDEEGLPILNHRDIVGTVVFVTLNKMDIRKELNTVKETVDMLVVSSLEG